MDKMKKNKKQKSGFDLTNAEDCFQLFNDMPLPYAIMSVDADDNGYIRNATFLFASRKLAELMRVNAKEMVGDSILKGDVRSNSSLMEKIYLAAYEGKQEKETFYSKNAGLWLTVTLDQAGGKGRCAILFEDVTKEKIKNEKLSKEWRTDDLIISCIKLLHGGRPFTDAIDMVFAKVGNTMGADRLYLVETKDGVVFNETHEWVNTGIEPVMEHFQGLTREHMLNWESEFIGANSLIVDDLETLQAGHKRLYSYLKEFDIKSIIEVPIYDAGHLVAYLGSTGQDNQNILDVKELIETISYFIASEFNRQRLMTELERKSTYDALSGVKNRSAMEQDIKRYHRRDEPIGVIYADANGLKTVNDTKGHEAGDALLKAICSILIKRFNENHVYRAGGDEFIIMLPGIEKEVFDTEYQRMLNDFKNADGISVSFGASWAESTKEIEVVMREADQKMYECKTEYYRINNRRKNKE